jgi:hypothetical protein
MHSVDHHVEVMRELAKADSAAAMDPNWIYARRGFLKSSVATIAAIGSPLGLFGVGPARATELPNSPDYGALAPVADESTGLPLLQLPAGFRYWSFGWTGDAMSDGVATPGSHDGMAVVAASADKLVLVRNHEQGSRTAGSFAGPKHTYDALANGGTSNMVFAPKQKKWLSDWASLSGTIRNCAGGPTPWNTWITCEETSDGPHNGAGKQHGYCFEIPSAGGANPVPLIAMGCFSHEAVAVDPLTGIIYETEDSTPSGLYRFIPKVPGRPASGGKLQMMKLAGVAHNATISIDGTDHSYYDTSVAQTPGTTWDVEWVDINQPNKPFVSGTLYGGVRAQGLMQGASSLRRGEGAWYGNGVIFVCSTSGGATGNGQIFAHDPRRQTLTMLFESGGNSEVDNPDNIAWSPRGSLLLCEDGDATPQALRGLTLDGTIFPFCRNNVNFNDFGAVTRPSGRVFSGDQRGSEFAGATFHNEWMFVNIQSPGITFAITGPWDNGAL